MRKLAALTLAALFTVACGGPDDSGPCVDTKLLDRNGDPLCVAPSEIDGRFCTADPRAMMENPSLALACEARGDVLVLFCEGGGCSPSCEAPGDCY